MRPRPGCGPLSREVGFPSVGPPMADPSVQFPERGFICPNSSDLLHGAVGKPLARQELFSRTPLQPTKPDCWMEGLLAPGIAAVPTTALLQRYAEVFGGRKRV